MGHPSVIILNAYLRYLGSLLDLKEHLLLALVRHPERDGVVGGSGGGGGFRHCR
jgi:hypothetical protein